MTHKQLAMNSYLRLQVIVSERDKLLIAGYIRDSEAHMIPDVIGALILDFYVIRIRPIELFDSNRYGVSADGLTIKGTSKCSGHLLYPEMPCTDGVSKGVHYWSIRCNFCVACYRYVGVISERNAEYVAYSKKETVELLNGTGGVHAYLFPNSSGHWKLEKTVTVKLDCRTWTVSYKHDEEEWVRKDIKHNQKYFFVFRMCTSAKNYFECVETPLHHL